MQSFSLDYAADNGTMASTETQSITFDETDSYVIRCTSINDSNRSLVLTASKAKSAEIQYLIFIRFPEEQNNNSLLSEIAYVPVDEDEGKYDINQAIHRRVSVSSAQDVIDAYGFTYDNWLMGTLSQDDLFPCCQ